ncbi:WhiB family transcriptional regulator [Streptomyces sp.]|uniref:WhiB family transcriptional regulator n=1 Tax=Streptomyces sp. TaxID=1931 RepID=UPI002F95E8CC
MTDLDWHHQAACRDLPTLLFFPLEGERPAERDRRELQAKAVCHTCPVWRSCLEEALDRNDKHGVWGGLTPDERVSVRRRLQRTGALSTVARPRPRVTVSEKRCCRCQELLSAELFYADNRATDGLTSACKGCQHARERQGRRDAREAVA